MRELLWGVSLAVWLAGCGDTGTVGSQSQDAAVDEKPAPTVFDPMTETMDRAATVEDINANRKSSMDEAIDGSD